MSGEWKAGLYAVIPRCSPSQRVRLFAALPERSWMDGLDEFLLRFSVCLHVSSLDQRSNGRSQSRWVRLRVGQGCCQPPTPGSLHHTSLDATSEDGVDKVIMQIKASIDVDQLNPSPKISWQAWGRSSSIPEKTYEDATREMMALCHACDARCTGATCGQGGWCVAVLAGGAASW